MTYRIYTHEKTHYQTDDYGTTLRQFSRPVVISGNENDLQAKLEELKKQGFAIAEVCNIYGKRIDF